VRKPSQGPWLTLGGDGVVAGLQPGDSPQVGPYRLVGRLGCGGMGRVFLGLSAGGRPVAVKVIRAELAADPEFRIRFSREVAAARQVSGLFTALVVDADVDGPVPWLATAYVAGPSLSEAVSSHGPMSSRSALVLAAGLAEGLSAIHAASVVHCDLKPSNVLLSQDGPRVIDFGISRAAEAISVTGAGLVVGSPGFMSPEQAEGKEIGPPSDVFSLGTVLAFAATGRGPFGEGSSPELAYRLVYGQPSLDPIPAELRPLVEHCLAKDPSQRPTADEVLAEVGAVQAATGCLADMAIGAFAEYCLPSPVLVTSRPSVPSASPVPSAKAGRAPGAAVPPPRREPNLRRRLWRPLAVAGVAASVIAASAAISFALAGAIRHPPAVQLQPRTAAIGASSAPSPASSVHAAAPSRFPRSSSSPTVLPGVIPADITPAVDTVTSPATPTAVSPSASASPSASGHPSPSKSPVPSKSPTASPSPTASASATPSPSPSTSPAPPVPQITSAGTYQDGELVYFDVVYADPGQDAQGFGFTGSDGNRWVEGTYPFSSPGRGIAGPDRIAYPLNLGCGTASQHKAEIEAWVYDTAGISSQPVFIDLSCKS
jgi:eukaryotic-like serine/threonine-protein kinase